MVPEAAAWPAPAKINLFLHVNGRRADGYHDLQTVFQLLDWGDELFIEVSQDRHVKRRGSLPGVAEEEDLSIRAARLLQQVTGVDRGARIRINKRIPAGAGLGGGSSDAATALRALNSLWRCGLDTDGLAEIALELGADVPLFVRGLSAWGSGVGERLTPVDLGQRRFLILWAGVSVSTAEVFANPALRRNSPPLAVEDFLADSGAGGFRNDCQPVVLGMFPELRSMVEEASPWGRLQMTGTGGAFFIEFEDENRLQEATNALKSRYNVRAVGGVNRSPLLERLTEK